MNFTILSAAIAGAIGFGLAWQLQAHQIVKLELTHANERISLQHAARQATERYMSQVSAAQANAQTRRVAIQRDADLAGTELDSLRTQSAATLRAATENAAACIADATAKTELLALCAGRYSGMAATADSWRSDAMTLVDAWPK
jgi:hypothetical protein